MKLAKLIKCLKKYNIYSGSEDFEVKGISCNSKNAGDNFIFVAVKGARADGNRFIEEAIANGARAIIKESQSHKVTMSPEGILFIGVADARKACADLAAEFYGNPSEKIKVVGITGTNGKTTISYLIEAIIKEANKIPAVIGTINYRFKDKLIIAKNTTPGPVELQSMLASMSEEGVDYCLIEVSSHALDQNRTEGVRFSSAVFTNLTQDHLDYHGTTENYFLSKAKLFANIGRNSFAIINNDDIYGQRLNSLSACHVINYAIQNKAQIMAKDIEFDISHSAFTASCAGREIKLRARLIGIHNIYNILASIAWALKEGFDLSVIKSAIEGFNTVPGRLERIDFKGNFSVFVDYAHTEDALGNVITALKQVSKHRIIVVFGCGGERDKTKRPKMGRIVTELADYAVITNDNPRSEDPIDIIDDIKKGISKDNYCVIPGRMEAIKKSFSIATAGDVVLIAGKGHENYQILKDKTLEFDDRVAAKRCLAQEYGVGS